MPNFLVISGDDVGVDNVSAYSLGIMGCETPNIERMARDGAIFTHAYAQQSSTARCGAYLMGRHPFRTGMPTIGMPGSADGNPDWTPATADIMRERGSMTAQHGKNHIDDQDHHLPAKHWFDEFFCNLYHLNADDEAERSHRPKDSEYRTRFGPRGVLRSSADGEIEDTGPMTRKRMKTDEEEVLDASVDFIRRAHEQGRPFFLWHNSTGMHGWTHLTPESQGVTGIGLYPDEMVEHDCRLGVLLDLLDELGIADNTPVMCSTDRGAETVSWSNGGTTPFQGEQGATWEGGFRVPLLVKWPRLIEPGSCFNGIGSHEVGMPTFAARIGKERLVETLREGDTLNSHEYRAHLDGHDMVV